MCVCVCVCSMYVCVCSVSVCCVYVCIVCVLCMCVCVCVCVHACELILCIDAIAQLSQPEQAYKLYTELRERAIETPSGTVKSTADLDRVHMHMLVSSLLGTVWAPGLPVSTLSYPARAKWSAEGIEGYFALDRTWVMLKTEYKKPLIERLNRVLPHTLSAHSHPSTQLSPSLSLVFSLCVYCID